MSMETARVIAADLPELKENLSKKGFNIIRINSKQSRRLMRCEAAPETNLDIEEIKILDFKV